MFQSRTDTVIVASINVKSTVSKEGVLLQLTNNNVICQFWTAVNLVREDVAGAAKSESVPATLITMP